MLSVIHKLLIVTKDNTTIKVYQVYKIHVTTCNITQLMYYGVSVLDNVRYNDYNPIRTQLELL